MDIPSLFMIPSAVSSGKVHSVFPNSTDADFDFNRDSSATRVNSQGLIETVGYFSTEKLTGFTNGTTYAFTTFTTSGNNITSAIVSSAFAGAVSNAISVTSGQIYRVTFDYTKNSGNDLRVVFSSSTNGAGAQISNNHLVSSSGSYSFDFTITSTTTGYLQMGTGNSGHSLNVSISNVSVKEIQGDRARLNYEIEGGLVNTKPSLLLEPQSTNLITYSEDFTQSDWVKLGIGSGSSPILTKNYAISPDGSKNATRLQCNLNSGTTNSDQSLIYDLYSSSSNQTISIYMKSNTGSNQNVYFANTVSTGDTAVVTSEWQRFTFSHSSSTYVLAVGLRGGTGADDTLDISIFAAQAEALSYATSYIPTNGSTQTRAAESCNGAGTSSILPSEEGILYVEVKHEGQYTVFKEISISDSTMDNRITFYNPNASDALGVSVVSSGSVVVNDYVSGVDLYSFSKYALLYKQNDFKLYVNGELKFTDTSGNTPTGLSQVQFAKGDPTGSYFYGKVRDIRVYNTKEMTDSEVDILLTKITS